MKRLVFVAVLLLAVWSLKQWPRYGELLKEVALREREAWESRQPVPHVYAVVPAERP